MVKNTTGGSKTKGQARKLVSSTHTEHLRLSTGSLEQYACVTKIYGNGRCAVITVSGLELQCVIRKKFSGKLRRNNIITAGGLILAGLREWEGEDNYKTCDVLEVYSTDEIIRLRDIPSTGVSGINMNAYSGGSKASNTDRGERCNFEFSNDADDMFPVDIAPQRVPGVYDGTLIAENDIDIDDI
jgi:hypothetical protein